MTHGQTDMTGNYGFSPYLSFLPS